MEEQGRQEKGLRGGALDWILFLVLLETTPPTPAHPALQLVTTFCQFCPRTASTFSHLAISGASILVFSCNLLESFQWCLFTDWIDLNLPIWTQQPRPGPWPLFQARLAFPYGCLHTSTTEVLTVLSGSLFPFLKCQQSSYISPGNSLEPCFMAWFSLL